MKPAVVTHSDSGHFGTTVVVTGSDAANNCTEDPNNAPGDLWNCTLSPGGSVSLGGMVQEPDPTYPYRCGPATTSTHGTDSYISTSISPSVVGSGPTTPGEPAQDGSCVRRDSVTVTISEAASGPRDFGEQQLFAQGDGSLCNSINCSTYTESFGTLHIFHATATPSPTPSPTPPPLVIFDCDYNRKLSDYPKKVVGEIVDLKPVPENKLSCSDNSVSSAQWSVPGKTVGNYTRTRTEAHVTPAQFDAPEIKFYFTAATSAEISVNATTKDGQQPASSTADVLAPTATITVVQTPFPTVDRNYHPAFGVEDPSWTAHFGQELRPSTEDQNVGTGVRWRYVATTPAFPDAAGVIGMTQLINDATTQTSTDGVTATTTFFTYGQFWPDGLCVLYSAPANISAPGSAFWSDNDAPATALGPLTPLVHLEDSFEDYFMYKSSHHNSIWVTLKRYDWAFSVDAKMSKDAVWSGQRASSSGSEIESKDLPTWTVGSNASAVRQCGGQ